VNLDMFGVSQLSGFISLVFIPVSRRFVILSDERCTFNHFSFVKSPQLFAFIVTCNIKPFCAKPHSFAAFPFRLYAVVCVCVCVCVSV